MSGPCFGSPAHSKKRPGTPPSSPAVPCPPLLGRALPACSQFLRWDAHLGSPRPNPSPHPPGSFPRRRSQLQGLENGLKSTNLQGLGLPIPTTPSDNTVSPGSWQTPTGTANFSCSKSHPVKGKREPPSRPRARRRAKHLARTAHFTPQLPLSPLRREETETQRRGHTQKVVGPPLKPSVPDPEARLCPPWPRQVGRVCGKATHDRREHRVRCSRLPPGRLSTSPGTSGFVSLYLL